MGRRPMYKSDEFFQSTSLVDQIFLILLWSTVEQVLHLLGAGVYREILQYSRKEVGRGPEWAT